MTTFAADTVFTTLKGAEVSQVPDGYVIYEPKSERVHYLNPTAVVVYELCVAGRSVGQIEGFLQDAYALPEAPSQSVRECLASLVKEGLIQACAPSSSAP